MVGRSAGGLPRACVFAGLQRPCSTGALLPAGAVAAPTIGPGGQFSFYAPDEEAPEQSPHAIVGDRATNDVWASTIVAKRVSSDPTEPNFAFRHVLRRFSPSGERRASFETREAYYDLDLSLDGQTLYAPTGPGPEGVKRISASTGEVLGSFANPDSGPGRFRFTLSADVAPDGDVYVEGAVSVNPTTRAIKRFSAAGDYEADVTLGQSDKGRGITAPAVDFRNGDLLVGDIDSSGAVHVDRYEALGDYRFQFGSGSPQGGELDGAWLPRRGMHWHSGSGIGATPVDREKP